MRESTPQRIGSKADLNAALRYLDRFEKAVGPKRQPSADVQTAPTVLGRGFTIADPSASAASVGSTERVNGANDIDVDAAFDGSVPTQRVQAESGTLSGEAIVESRNAGYDGGGYVSGLTSVGSGILLGANADGGRAYDLELRYASGKYRGKFTDRTVSLYINGVKDRVLTAPNTGAWDSYATLVASVDLDDGANTIEFRFDTGDDGSINIDYIDVKIPDQVPGFESGLDVVAGSFTVNGESIAVGADDSVNDVLARINASAAGVSASFDTLSQRVEIVSDASGSASGVTLAGDTSGFLQATKLAAATTTPGRDPALERSLDELAAFASVNSGTLSIGGQAIVLDPASQSLQDVLDAINAADAGVVASLSGSGGSYRAQLTGSASEITLDDGGTGFFAALGFSQGRYGSSSPVSGGADRELGQQIDRATRVRSYRAADKFEDLGRVFGGLLSDPGAERLRTALGSLFEEVRERFGERELERIGLDFLQLDGELFQQDRLGRRRFTSALQSGNDTLRKILLDGYAPGKEGLIDALRELLKDELADRNGGRRVGALLDTYA